VINPLYLKKVSTRLRDEVSRAAEEYSIPPLPQLAHDLQGIVPRP
jgi:hypothetical protein